jgi:hypothetical protein
VQRDEEIQRRLAACEKIYLHSLFIRKASIRSKESDMLGYMSNKYLLNLFLVGLHIESVLAEHFHVK